MLRSWIAIVPFMVSQAFGQAIIHVPADAPTIQIAIEQAQPFDTIIVAPGTYYETISFLGKAISAGTEKQVKGARDQQRVPPRAPSRAVALPAARRIQV